MFEESFKRLNICNAQVSYRLVSNLCAAAKWKNTRKLNHNKLGN